MPDLFREIIPSILERENKDLFMDDPEMKTYNEFVINLKLSYYQDTIFFANEMNKRPGINKDAHYKYLVNSVRKYKRPYTPWIKGNTIEDIELVEEYFRMSRQKAMEALSVLTKEDLNNMREQLGKGEENG